MSGVERTFYDVAFQSRSAHYRTRACRGVLRKQNSLPVAHSTPTNSNKTKGQARVFRREGHYAPFISSLARAENPLDNRFTGSNHSLLRKMLQAYREDYVVGSKSRVDVTKEPWGRNCHDYQSITSGVA